MLRCFRRFSPTGIGGGPPGWPAVLVLLPRRNAGAAQKEAWYFFYLVNDGHVDTGQQDHPKPYTADITTTCCVLLYINSTSICRPLFSNNAVYQVILTYLLSRTGRRRSAWMVGLALRCGSVVAPATVPVVVELLPPLSVRMCISASSI